MQNNTIHGNGGIGVSVLGGTGNLISRNSISQNGPLDVALGIDHGADGVTQPDNLDADVGPNNLQNFPVVTSVIMNIPLGRSEIYGTLHSAPSTTFTIEVFFTNPCDPSEYGEGETYVGTTSAATDGTGNTTTPWYVYGPLLTARAWITATATDPNNNTSEFSKCKEHTPALMLDGRSRPARPPAETLTNDMLNPIVAEAVSRWAAATGDALLAERLGRVEVTISNLPEGYLGLAGQSEIWVDDDAAGYGWFIDLTPGDDAEFALMVGENALHALAGTVAGERIDVFTVIMHEIGHVIGLEHSEDGVMQERLAPGVRHPFGCACAACASAAKGAEALPAALVSETRASPALLDFGELFEADLFADDATPPASSVMASPAQEAPVYPLNASPAGGLFPLFTDNYRLSDGVVADGGTVVLLGGDGDSILIGAQGHAFLIGGL